MLHQRQRRRRQTASACGCLRPLIRIFGVMTAFVLCGVGVDIYLHGYERAGLGTVLSALAVLFLETKWIVTLFLMLSSGGGCGGDWRCCLDCWSGVEWAGGWRLAPPYLALGVALLLWPHNLWLSRVAGCMLIALALLRLGTLLLQLGGGAAKDEGLLPHCEFEKVEAQRCDIAEDCFAEIEPTPEGDDTDEDDDDDDDDASGGGADDDHVGAVLDMFS